MICEQCAQLPSCPPAVQGDYGRACWLAFGNEDLAPDCEHFVERYWRGGEGRGAWRRARRDLRHGRKRG